MAFGACSPGGVSHIGLNRRKSPQFVGLCGRNRTNRLNTLTPGAVMRGASLQKAAASPAEME
jgi:hypothetical protein